MGTKMPFWVRFFAMQEETGGGETTSGSGDVDNSNVEEPLQEEVDPPAEEPTESEQENTDAEDKAVEEWRNHSREWEKKAKRSLARVEKLEAQLAQSTSAEALAQVTAERDGLAVQVKIIRTLFAIGADAEALTDSRSFMDNAEALDDTDPQYEEKIRDLVAKSRGRAHGGDKQRLFFEGESDQQVDLYQLIHGNKD